MIMKLNDLIIRISINDMLSFKLRRALKMIILPTERFDLEALVTLESFLKSKRCPLIWTSTVSVDDILSFIAIKNLFEDVAYNEIGGGTTDEGQLMRTPSVLKNRLSTDDWQSPTHGELLKVCSDNEIVAVATDDGQLMSTPSALKSATFYPLMHRNETGVLVGGATGHAINVFGTSIKAIGNTGSNSTREAVHATEQGSSVGMHAALHINPYYGKTSVEGMVAHFECVPPMGPTVIYNVPSQTGQDIPPSVIHSIADSTNFAGVKECVGHSGVNQVYQKWDYGLEWNDDECHDSKWDHDATGVISGTSNLVLGLMHELLS